MRITFNELRPLIKEYNKSAKKYREIMGLPVMEIRGSWPEHLAFVRTKNSRNGPLPNVKNLYRKYAPIVTSGFGGGYVTLGIYHNKFYPNVQLLNALLAKNKAVETIREALYRPPKSIKRGIGLLPGGLGTKGGRLYARTISSLKKINVFIKMNFFNPIFRGNLETVRRLIYAGANVNSRDIYGYTPLMYAVIHKHLDIVRELIRAGADVNSRSNIGMTPLRLAADGNLDIVRELIRAGANVNSRDNTYGQTPLHSAAEHGDPETVRELLRRGANVNSRDKGGCTPLNLAASGSLDTVRELIRAGADVNTRDKTYGSTPLHTAAYAGRLAVVRELILAGANVNSRDKGGRTPICIALWLRYVNIARLLIQYGARVTRSNLNSTSNNRNRNTIATALGQQRLLKSVVRRAETAQRIRKTAARTPGNSLARAVFTPNRVKRMKEKYGNNWLNHV